MHEISGYERPSDEPPTRQDGMSKRAKFTKLGKREPRTDNLFSFEQSTQDEASQIALASVLEAIAALEAKVDALLQTRQRPKTFRERMAAKGVGHGC